MSTPTNFEGINPRDTQTLIPCKDAKAQNGVIANTKLIKDTVGWSGKNRFNYKNAVNATNVVSAVNMTSGDISIKDVTAQWSSTYIGYIDIENGKTYKLVADKVATYGRFGFSTSASLYPQSGSFPDNMITFSGTSPQTATKILFNGDISITAKASGRIYLWFCSDENYQTSHQAYTIKIMIADANILDLSYEPYFGLTAFPRSEQAVLGTKNLCPNTGASKTENNVTFTLNDDGSVTVDTGGQASSGTTFFYVNQWVNVATPFNDKDVILSGCPSGGGEETFRLDMIDSSGVTANKVDTGNGVLIPANHFGSNYTKQVRIRIASGQTISNKTFKPMIRLASDTDPTYVPYAMTNRALTDKVQGIIDAATNAADFAAFKTAIGNL